MNSQKLVHVDLVGELPTGPDHYQVMVMAEVEQVAWGGWKAVIFLFKLLYSYFHHLAVAVVDGSDDDITQALFLVKEAHPPRKASLTSGYARMPP